MRKAWEKPHRTKTGRYAAQPSEAKQLVDAALTNTPPPAPCPECGRMYEAHMTWCSRRPPAK
jgi:hypothetical protein